MLSGPIEPSRKIWSESDRWLKKTNLRTDDMSGHECACRAMNARLLHLCKSVKTPKCLWNSACVQNATLHRPHFISLRKKCCLLYLQAERWRIVTGDKRFRRKGLLGIVVLGVQLNVSNIKISTFKAIQIFYLMLFKCWFFTI